MPGRSHRGGWPRGYSPVTEKIIKILRDAKGDWVPTSRLASAVYDIDASDSVNMGLARARLRALICNFNRNKKPEQRIHSFNRGRGTEESGYRFPSKEKPASTDAPVRVWEKAYRILREHVAPHMTVEELASAVYGTKDAATIHRLNNAMVTAKKLGEMEDVRIVRFRRHFILAYRIQTTSPEAKPVPRRVPGNGVDDERKGLRPEALARAADG